MVPWNCHSVPMVSGTSVTVVWQCALEMFLESTPPHYYGGWARTTQNPQPSSCCAIRSVGDSQSIVLVPAPTSLQASHSPDLILQGKASQVGYWQSILMIYTYDLYKHILMVFSYSILSFFSFQPSVLVYHYKFSILLSFLTIPQL